jgi:hypothetical protein
MAAHEDRTAETGAAATAAGEGVATAAAVAALSQGVADRKVFDRGRDRVGRVADEEGAELVVTTNGEMRGMLPSITVWLPRISGNSCDSVMVWCASLGAKVIFVPG